jgi:hypothetical protein
MFQDVTHKKPYRRYEGKTNDVLIAFIGYVNDLKKLQRIKVSVQNSTIDINVLFNPLGSGTCSSPEVVLAYLLYEGSTIHNASGQFVSCVYFFFVDFAFHPTPTDRNLKE